MPSAAVKTMGTSITISQNNKTSEGGEVKAQPSILSIADPLEPFRQTVTLVEHKIRNMEKRKGKLDSYKQEQEQGKELNADQLAAIAKYGEVVQNLDFARDLVKQFTTIQLETGRLMKKQSKKEQVEKAAAELERAKDTIRLSNCIQQLAIPRVREDFAIGKNGAILVGAEELKALDELSVISGLKFKHETSGEDLERAAEHLLNLLEGKPKPVCASSGKTYKDLKELLTSLTDCEYFGKNPAKGSSSSDACKDTVEVLSAERDSAQLVAQEPKYAFAKEPQLDIQTPHMDPAVVAVSSYAPPPMGSQVRGSQLAPHKSASVGSLPHGQTVPQAQHTVEIQATNVFSINAMNTNSLSMARVNHGMDSMNLNNLQTEPPTDSSEIDQWNPDESKYQQSTNNKFRRSSGHNSESAEQYEIEFFDPQSATGSRAGNNNWSNDMLTGGDRSHGYRRGTGDRERGGFRGGRGMNGYRGRGGGGGNRWNGPPNDRFDEQRNNFAGGDREYKPRGGSRGVGNGRGGNQFNGGGRRPYRGGGFNSGAGGQDAGVMNVFS